MRGIGPITLKEMEVLKLLAEHRTNKDISTILCISKATLYQHIASIMIKTDIHKRELLVKYALENYGKNGSPA